VLDTIMNHAKSYRRRLISLPYASVQAINNTNHNSINNITIIIIITKKRITGKQQMTQHIVKIVSCINCPS
jgi:hypothetical protein